MIAAKPGVLCPGFLAFLCAVAACAPPPPHPAARSSPSPTPSAAALPSLPAPARTGSVPTPAGLGTAPIAYTVPAGYHVLLATDQLVQLASAAQSERLTFAIDPAIENTSSAIGTMPIAGATGYILQRGDTGGLYSEVVVLRHAGRQWEASCIGYHGYDAAVLEQGCATFLASIRFGP